MEDKQREAEGKEEEEEEGKEVEEKKENLPQNKTGKKRTNKTKKELVLEEEERRQKEAFYEKSIPPLVASEKKLASWAFYQHMGSPKRIVAPMVDQSELPFRMLCRKYGSDLCYTPMFHSANFSTSENYRNANFSTCKEDRPVLVQFCANDPDVFLAAAKFVEGVADGVDLNLGCPQRIAKRGYYGSFLQENQELIFRLLNRLHLHLAIPVTVKIRILDTPEETLQYAKMVQDAGAQILAVHGRTRIQKGQLAGHADWSMIKLIKDHVSIPVIANGSVERFSDIEECEKESNADGLMSAQGLLRNPALFSGKRIKEVDLAEEYLDFVEMYPTKKSAVKAHLYKILQITCNEDVEIAQAIGEAKEVQEFREILQKIRKDEKDVFFNDDDEAAWSFPSRHTPIKEGGIGEDVAGVSGLFEEE